MVGRAVIWDMDGVIVDTASWHFTAWRQLCHRHGRILGEEQFRATFGQRNQEIVQMLFGVDQDDAVVRTLSDEKEALFRATMGSQASPLPGVVPLLSALQCAGYVQAIGSSAPLRNIEMLLNAVGVRHFFQAIVAEEDVRAGKPDPEIFLLAAERLGVAPGRCLVIEDAVAGVAAAKAAGMACLAVTNTRDRQALSAADLVVGSLAEVNAATIARLMQPGCAQGAG